MVDDMQYNNEGEVSGAFLLGLAQSFQELHVIDQVRLAMDLNKIDPEQWYPFELLTSTIIAIEKLLPQSDILYFFAGSNFLRIWYEQGPGKHMISSGMDWLHANDSSGGYNSVVRSSNKTNTGWCLLRTIDEQAGIAVYENVTPLNVDFVRGVFYGGCILFNDMDYVEVDATSEPFAENPSINNITITVKFKLAPANQYDLDGYLATQQGKDTFILTSEQTNRLVWRYIGLNYRKSLDESYFKTINKILSNTIAANQRVTQKLQETEAELRSMAFYDMLTQLPNRRLLLDRLQRALVNCNRLDSYAALLFLDLNKFKQLNDSYGHEAGDLLLKEVAKRLLQQVREVDTVARIGGDEFVVLQEGLGPNTTVAEESAALVVTKIHESLNQAYIIADNTHFITASVGVHLFNDDETSPDQIIRLSDASMYEKKKCRTEVL